MIKNVLGFPPVLSKDIFYSISLVAYFMTLAVLVLSPIHIGEVVHRPSVSWTLRVFYGLQSASLALSSAMRKIRSCPCQNGYCYFTLFAQCE